MSAAVAGAVGAVAGMNRTRFHGSYGSYNFSRVQDSELNREYVAYQKDEMTDHLAVLLFIKKVRDGAFDNKYLVSLAKDLINEHLKFLDLDDIKPVIMMLLADEIDSLHKDMKRYLLRSESVRTEFIRFRGYVRRERRKALAKTDKDTGIEL